MTNEEAIRILDPATTSDTLKGYEKAEAIKAVEDACMIAIDAIKKQISIEPKTDKRKGREVYCPVCGGYVGWFDGTKSDTCNYCPDCGQAIKK